MATRGQENTITYVLPQTCLGIFVNWMMDVGNRDCKQFYVLRILTCGIVCSWVRNSTTMNVGVDITDLILFSNTYNTYKFCLHLLIVAYYSLKYRDKQLMK
jgi:hypothetical protein